MVCFLYCFFAIVLGAYLGLELISVRRAGRVYRTMLKAAEQSAEAVSTMAEIGANGPGSRESNYFGR